MSSVPDIGLIIRAKHCKRSAPPQSCRSGGAALRRRRRKETSMVPHPLPIYAKHRFFLFRIFFSRGVSPFRGVVRLHAGNTCSTIGGGTPRLSQGRYQGALPAPLCRQYTPHHAPIPPPLSLSPSLSPDNNTHITPATPRPHTLHKYTAAVKLMSRGRVSRGSPSEIDVHRSPSALLS